MHTIYELGCSYEIEQSRLKIMSFYLKQSQSYNFFYGKSHINFFLWWQGFEPQALYILYIVHIN